MPTKAQATTRKAAQPASPLPPTNGRNPNGTFAEGNPGGPGRPRRSVELDYLVTLSEACPLDIWRKIVQKAVEDALAGDAKARQFLADYLCKTEATLLTITADEEAGIDRVAHTAKSRKWTSKIEDDLSDM